MFLLMKTVVLSKFHSILNRQSRTKIKRKTTAHHILRKHIMEVNFTCINLILITLCLQSLLLQVVYFKIRRAPISIRVQTVYLLKKEAKFKIILQILNLYLKDSLEMRIKVNKLQHNPLQRVIVSTIIIISQKFPLLKIVLLAISNPSLIQYLIKFSKFYRVLIMQDKQLMLGD